jgi:hypothetical protein
MRHLLTSLALDEPAKSEAIMEHREALPTAKGALILIGLVYVIRNEK